MTTVARRRRRIPVTPLAQGRSRGGRNLEGGTRRRAVMVAQRQGRAEAAAEKNEVPLRRRRRVREGCRRRKRFGGGYSGALDSSILIIGGSISVTVITSVEFSLLTSHIGRQKEGRLKKMGLGVPALPFTLVAHLLAVAAIVQKSAGNGESGENEEKIRR
ncbi:hypothetical protein PIB30_035173 [Stylosanthes scabra]|uniref:Uncharacterized protein n=1 Tax=Stylosanthes scabra TaxID=79078 RepID=A0ABU6YAD0_9FABA|nr:hypothetical protein [Stylosanthes scabra]